MIRIRMPTLGANFFVKLIAGGQIAVNTFLLVQIVYVALRVFLYDNSDCPSFSVIEVQELTTVSTEFVMKVVFRIYFSVLGIAFGIVWFIGLQMKKIYLVHVWCVYALVVCTLISAFTFWNKHLIPLWFVISTSLICIGGLGLTCEIIVKHEIAKNGLEQQQEGPKVCETQV